jgi:hypothetical protein
LRTLHWLTRILVILAVVAGGFSVAPVGLTRAVLAADIPHDLNLDWNTFYGEGAVSRGIAVDSAGNTYITGYSDWDWGNPVREYSSYRDAFVAKVDSNGYLVWNTFLGGDGWEYGQKIAVSTDGDVFVSGLGSVSWGDPIRELSQQSDGFVAKLDKDGNLIWNTFLGGDGSDECNSIAVDGDDNVFVIGNSDMVWGDPVQTQVEYGGTFIVCLNTDGGLSWNTFLGGKGADIKLDNEGLIYVTGYSWDSWGEPLIEHSDKSDAFVAQVSADGILLWNTFLGGGGDDWGRDIDLNSSGEVYFSGYCDATWGEPLREYTAGQDAFAGKLDNSGNLLWNTFLGGNAEDQSLGIAVDSQGYALVSGYSYSSWGDPQRAYTAEQDGFAALLSSDGDLQSNTFLGGSDGDFSADVAVDSDNNFYLAGSSGSAWGDPVQPYSWYDGFVAKLDYVYRVKTPAFAPAPGSYTSAQKVKISCATAGATIRYTTNGAEPTASSTKYSGVITVSSTKTLKAKAFKTTMTASNTATAKYSICVATPVISLEDGFYDSVQKVTLKCVTSGAAIRYTVDGSEPTASSTKYSSALTLNTTTILKAKAFKSGLTESAVATGVYEIVISPVDNPVILPAAGDYTSAQKVKISCSTSGATIRYTTNGKEPTATSTRYNGVITVSKNTTIKAKAFKTGMAASETTTATYNISVAVPVFSPAGGSYSGPKSVKISCSTSGATIRYSTDGSEPTSASTKYSTPISIKTTTTLKARAFKNGLTDSVTATATYTFVK